MVNISTPSRKVTSLCHCAQTAAEIEEYCRDPDSTGCSLDDIEALMAEAEKLKKVSTPAKEVRWSPGAATARGPTLASLRPWLALLASILHDAPIQRAQGPLPTACLVLFCVVWQRSTLRSLRPTDVVRPMRRLSYPALRQHSIYSRLFC